LPDDLTPQNVAAIREILRRGGEVLGIPLSLSQIENFVSYTSLLLQWNRVFNLTSLSDPREIARLHFLDSLAITPFIDKLGPLMDIGSGPGFPGMPLKIAFNDISLTLVEPRRKRANFLRALRRQIQAGNVNIIENRLESINADATGLFSTVVLRAVGNLEAIISSIRPFVRGNGKCLIMHGPMGNTIFPTISLCASRAGFSRTSIHNYVIPLGKESRTLIKLRP
jgi:16S rRNA (guanine527-N7)-methyltransferase